mmetsp:Transcript_130654/g.377958  ORF Transcript_130654/g.377958 Transcript_130654/m.377958 type:complete len:107 (-) Transcript_130654:77-397(-)
MAPGDLHIVGAKASRCIVMASAASRHALARDLGCTRLCLNYCSEDCQERHRKPQRTRPSDRQCSGRIPRGAGRGSPRQPADASDRTRSLDWPSHADHCERNRQNIK